MKKFIYLCMATLMLALTACVTTSCDNHHNDEKGHRPTRREMKADSAYFSDMVAYVLPEIITETNAMVPHFNNVTDVVAHQDVIAHDMFVNEVFVGLTPQIVANVSTVLLRHSKYVTIPEIVEEYQRNARIYNSLPIEELAALQVDESKSVKEAPSPKTDKKYAVVVDTVWLDDNVSPSKPTK